jgi:hypothetical protein
MGFIISSINSILEPLKTILGAFDMAGNILGFVSGILSSISCDEEPVCPKIKEWSVWDGPVSNGPENVNVSGIVDKMRQFSVPVDPDNFDFNLDFNDVFQDSCNIGAIFCGPPIVKFSGGGGSGVEGNAIISLTGEIIGVDITNSGQGFTSSPIVNFYDSCGRGYGAVGRATIVNNSVTNVIVMDTGSGYLQAQDGSTGGDGRTLTEPIVDNNNIYPSKTNGQYPVIMKLEEIYIDNGGSNYSPDDKIIIEPSNGASASAIISASGVILRVDVINSGEGFKEMPAVYIRSRTGYRANLIPRLGVVRVGDDLTTLPINYEKVINVIDCPGK